MAKNVKAKVVVPKTKMQLAGIKAAKTRAKNKLLAQKGKSNAGKVKTTKPVKGTISKHTGPGKIHKPRKHFGIKGRVASIQKLTECLNKYGVTHKTKTIPTTAVLKVLWTKAKDGSYIAVE